MVTNSPKYTQEYAEKHRKRNCVICGDRCWGKRCMTCFCKHTTKPSTLRINARNLKKRNDKLRERVNEDGYKKSI